MLTLTQSQMAAFEQAFGPAHPTADDARARLLRLETPWTSGLDPNRRTARVDQALGWARARGLLTDEALLCYASLSLEFGPAFHHSPGVARLLIEADDRNLAAPQLARRLTVSDWALIRRRAADLDSWFGDEDWRI